MMNPNPPVLDATHPRRFSGSPFILPLLHTAPVEHISRNTLASYKTSSSSPPPYGASEPPFFRQNRSLSLGTIELPPIKRILNSSSAFTLPPIRHDFSDGESRQQELPLVFKFSNEGLVDVTKNSKKRRQRTGPSCDSCRVRKVKCDAEIVILKDLKNSGSISPNGYRVIERFEPKDYSLTEKALEQIYREFYGGAPDAETSSHMFIKTATKLIRFKSCTACKMRNGKCHFSKGFTRADIMKFNRFKRTKE